MIQFRTLKQLFLLTIFCAPLYLVRFNFFDLPTNLFEILAFFCILLLLLQKKKLFFTDLKKLPKVFLSGCLLIIAGLLLSTLFNKNYREGFGILKSWFIIPMLFSWSLYQIMNSEQDILNIFKSIFFSTATVGLIGFSYEVFGFVTYDHRLSAFYLSPNYLAMYLAPGVFLGIYLLRLLQQNKKSTAIQKFFYLLSFSVILLPLYYTYSYGTWLAIILSLAITAFLFSPKKYSVKSFILLLFCVLLLSATQIQTQKLYDLLHHSSRSSLASRLTIWQVSWRLVEENPLTGIGAGNFQPAYLAQQPNFPPYLEWAVPEPHNIFLAFWLEAGVLGLTGFLILLFFIFSALWKLSQNKNSATFAAPLFAYFLYIAAHGLIDTTYWKNDLSFIFWVCVSLCFFLHTFSQKNISA